MNYNLESNNLDYLSTRDGLKGNNSYTIAHVRAYVHIAS